MLLWSASHYCNEQQHSARHGYGASTVSTYFVRFEKGEDLLLEAERSGTESRQENPYMTLVRTVERKTSHTGDSGIRILLEDASVCLLLTYLYQQ